MRILRRMTMPQRVVLVVALGLLVVSGWAWWYFGEVAPVNDGWFAYAPDQQTDTYWYATTRRPPEFLIVPVALVALWAAISIWLLGLRASPDSEAD
ncbi:hypothetical protein [Actinospongicola halichondriae]|uniref:hypothetical protein n=1 Tax=Actinospongicola halichondriae TaxID=3236844 RepID=UPI003D39F2F6